MNRSNLLILAAIIVAKWDGEFDRQAWIHSTTPKFEPQSETQWT